MERTLREPSIDTSRFARLQRDSIRFLRLARGDLPTENGVIRLLRHPLRARSCSLLLELSEYRSISMKQTRYITTTIQAGNRLEIDVPNLPIGQTIEVILIIPDMPESHPRSIDRRSFLKLSNAERRRLLAEQAEAALPYYAENQAEWEEWINLDLAATYAP